MRKLLILLLVVSAASTLHAQTVAEEIAGRISQKMKDSLGLNESQRQQVYSINMQLASQKQEARAASTDREVVRTQLQRIENTRDSLYQPILGIDKYAIYKQKKRNLVNNQ